MAKVKSTDPYGRGFFDEVPPKPEPAPSSPPPAPASAELNDAVTPLSNRGERRGAITEVEAHQTSIEPDTQPKVRLNADIDRDLHRRLRLRVASEGITIADFIRDVLQRELQ